MTNDLKAHTDRYYENERRLRAYCLLNGITHIHVYFDGSGDSGSIDNIEVKNSKTLLDITKCPKITVFTQASPEFNAQEQRWERQGIEERLHSFEDFIMDHVYQALEYTDVDWYNNEGGYGYWDWSVDNGVEFTIEQRIVAYETVHHECRELGYPEYEEQEDSV